MEFFTTKCMWYSTVCLTEQLLPLSNVCDHVSFSFPITNDGNDPHD